MTGYKFTNVNRELKALEAKLIENNQKNLSKNSPLK